MRHFDELPVTRVNNGHQVYMPNCGWVGTEDEMYSDYMPMSDEDSDQYFDEIWTDHACPNCQTWHELEDYKIVDDEDK